MKYETRNCGKNADDVQGVRTGCTSRAVRTRFNQSERSYSVRHGGVRNGGVRNGLCT